MVTELVVEALFALVFVRVLVTYARRRDPLQADVAMMFAVVAMVFVLAMAQRLIGEPPVVLSLVASAFLLGQPFLTLRLVRRVGSVPSWLYWAAFAGWLASVGVLLTIDAVAPTWALVVVVGSFVITEVIAAIFLTRLARQRRGAPRTRLAAAAVGTALFALAITVAGAGSGREDEASLWQHTTQQVALASALAYLLAFMPPGWLRRAWSRRAAATVVSKLVRTPADASSGVIWERYTESVCEVTGSDSAVVLCCTDDTVRELARMAVPSQQGALSATDCDELLSFASATNLATDGTPQPPAAAVSYARAADARFITVLPLRLHTGRGVLLLLNRHRSLFTDDDVELLGKVSGHAAALAQRAELLSDRDRLTGELTATVAALTTASKAKSDFMANMSHELRTPLNAIIGFSDLMRSEPTAGNGTTVPTEWVDHIHSSGEHLLGLINEVLDLAKIESGAVELQFEPLDLVEAVDAVVTSLEALSQQKDLDVTVAMPPVRLRADRMRLRQILTNLLSNAIKFTPEHGRIFLAGRRVGTEIAISVADTGAGIAAEDLERVFEEFRQVGDVKAQVGGTGLGLALTRRLVDAHGGRIELDSELGQGTKFTVYLPAADGPSLVSDPTTDRIDPTTDGIGQCAGVLIIEDDPATSRLLTTYLERAGYQVNVAESGEQGLLTARTCHPEVILLDVQLPGIDGWGILAQLKQDERLRHIPVVIISALEASDVGIALGAVDYFVKPVDRRTLLSWLARHGHVPPMGNDQMTVLAIDDDPASLDLIAASLDAEGIQVVCASSGAAGIALARSNSFDLVICDLLMPEVDGFDVIAALHSNPATHGTPVVVLTGHSLSEAEKNRLSGKVIAVNAKDASVTGLPELARTIGELTGLTAPGREVVA